MISSYQLPIARILEFMFSAYRSIVVRDPALQLAFR
jgi:hypothetical protein